MRPAPLQQALASFLTAKTSARASTVTPNPRPPSFTTITLAGGDRINLAMSTPRMVLRCWGPDERRAWDLVCEVYDVLDIVSDQWLSPDVWVAGVYLSEPANDPDPASSSPRYSMTYAPTVQLKETP